MSSVKSAYASAATYASKRVEEIRETVAQQQEWDLVQHILDFIIFIPKSFETVVLG